MGRLGKLWLVAIVSSLATACGGAEPSEAAALEEVGEQESALEQACAKAAAAVTEQHGIDAVSPRTYSVGRCFKGYVVQVDDYLTDEAAGPPGGEGGSAADSPAAFATWEDALPTTRDGCEAAWIGGYMFEQRPGSSFAYVDFKSVTGIWIGNGCAVPAIQFAPEFLVRGHNYKVAVSARTRQASSAPTRKVRVIVHGAI